jgi:hypothetical protein
VYGFILYVRGMPRVMRWPCANANMFLVTSRDLKFRVSNEGIEGLVLLDKEPGIVDEFKGKVSLGGGMDLVGGFF